MRWGIVILYLHLQFDLLYYIYIELKIELPHKIE